MNRKRLILIILLALLGLALGYAWWATPRQEHVAGQPTLVERPRVANNTGRPAGGEGEAGHVRLDLLTLDDAGFPGSKRNIFGSIQPPPPPPRPAPAALPVAAAASSVPPVAVALPPSAADVAQRELARFTFLGFLEKGGEQTVFLSGNNELFLVRKGSRFGRNQEFIVAGLTPEKLILRQVDDPREIVITLVEKAPLVPQKAASKSRASGKSRSVLPPRVQLRPPVEPEPPEELEPPQEIPGDDGAPPVKAEAQPESAPPESPPPATPSEVNQ